MFLLPQHDILAVEIPDDGQIQNSMMNIDSLLGGLFDKNHMELNGLMHNSKISALNKNERAFKWIHTLAGLKFHPRNQSANQAKTD